MIDQELKIKLSLIVQKSHSCLKAAQFLLEQAYYEDAAAKTYYAVFHAMQAALLSKGLTFSKHTGVKGGFNKEFIHTGIFPKEFVPIIERLFRDRQIADYEYLQTITADISQRSFHEGKKIVEAVEEYLRGEGLVR